MAHAKGGMLHILISSLHGGLGVARRRPCDGRTRSMHGVPEKAQQLMSSLAALPSRMERWWPTNTQSYCMQWQHRKVKQQQAIKHHVIERSGSL